MRQYAKDGKDERLALLHSICDECDSGDRHTRCRNCKPEQFQKHRDEERNRSRRHRHNGRLMLDRIKLRLTDGGT